MGRPAAEKMLNFCCNQDLSILLIANMKKNIILFFISTIAFNGYSQNKEELAIKQLLEKESATWRAGDIKGHADCWAVKPYSRILISTVEGNVIDLPTDFMINPPATMVGKGGFSINTNYKMNISGNNAWVSHNEESTAEDGTKNFTY
jgi:hypothetical protein